MVLLSGKISNTFLFLLYIAATVLLLMDKGYNTYEIQLFQAKSFLDCAVDNDNDKHTCFSAYNLVRSVIIPVHMLLITIFTVASFCRMGVLLVHHNHDLNIFAYVDGIFINTLVFSLICMLGGIQEVKFLSLVIICEFCIEVLYTYHDFYLDTSVTQKLYVTTWLIQLVLWSIIIISSGFYIANSYQLPIYIPLIVYTSIGLHILTKIFHARFFYHLVPKKLGYDIVETLNSIRIKEPYYIDWLNSWTNILTLLQRGLLLLFYILLSKNYKITYV